MVRAILAATAISIATSLAVVAPANASDDDCRYVARSEWRSIEEAAAAVKAKGYEVRKIERDDGCYEVYASGKSGERIKLYLDPGTLEVVRKKNRS